MSKKIKETHISSDLCPGKSFDLHEPQSGASDAPFEKGDRLNFGVRDRSRRATVTDVNDDQTVLVIRDWNDDDWVLRWRKPGECVASDPLHDTKGEWIVDRKLP